MAGPSKVHVSRVSILLAAGLALAACQSEIPKELTPVPPALQSKMDNLGMNETAPIYMRIFKEESKLEVWKQRRDGKYALLKAYDICKWSGELGPKKKEGDRQAPEGFYTVTPAQMNPQSNYYLSFNMGYPNTFDKAYGRTGSNLMVHGACSSAGCYSMTDDQVAEIFALARDAFRGGQTAFQVHAFPFRMTPQNMARHRDDPNFAFWQNLKRGYDHFEVTQVVPEVNVCDRRYVFNATPNGNASFQATASCPAYTVPNVIATAVAAKEARDKLAFEIEVARLSSSSNQAVASRAQPANATPVAMAAIPTPAPRPSLGTQRRSFLSRLFGGGRNNTSQPSTPAASTVAAQPAATPAATTAAAAPATPVQVPQARPTVVASTAPQTAPAPAPAAVPKPEPTPALRPTVEPEPEVATAVPPEPVGSSGPGEATPTQSAASSNFNNRFVVPVPTSGSLSPATASASAPAAQPMSGAAPMRATSGFGSADCDPAIETCPAPTQ